MDIATGPWSHAPCVTGRRRGPGTTPRHRPHLPASRLATAGVTVPAVRRDPRTNFCVPAFLAVTTVAGCGEGDRTTQATTSATEADTGEQTGSRTDPATSSPATTEPTTTEPAGTTTATTTTTDASTGADTGDTTGGELPECLKIPDMATCEATPGCVWDGFEMYCILDCGAITDQATCDGSNFCAWFDGFCEAPI